MRSELAGVPVLTRLAYGSRMHFRVHQPWLHLAVCPLLRKPDPRVSTSTPTPATTIMPLTEPDQAKSFVAEIDLISSEIEKAKDYNAKEWFRALRNRLISRAKGENAV